jgi:hypothetical protein
MRWECSECGYATREEEHAPPVCTCCGTAGGIFVEAEPGLEEDASAETMFDSWLYHGMRLADLPPHRHTSRSRHHRRHAVRHTPPL